MAALIGVGLDLIGGLFGGSDEPSAATEAEAAAAVQANLISQGELDEEKKQNAAENAQAKAELDETAADNKADNDREDKDQANSEDQRKIENARTDAEIARDNAREDIDNTRADDKFKRGEQNNFNIRKNFLENSMAAIRDMTMKQFNILIVTNQNNDAIKTPLKGRLLPMKLVEVELMDGEVINYEVYVFDEGEYIRTGDAIEDDNMRKDSIIWYPDDAKKDYHDAADGNPAGRYFQFVAQPKIDPRLLPKLKELQKKDKGRVDGVDRNITKNIGEDGAEKSGDEDEENDEDEEKKDEEEEEEEEEEEVEVEEEEEPEEEEEEDPQAGDDEEEAEDDEEKEPEEVEDEEEAGEDEEEPEENAEEEDESKDEDEEPEADDEEAAEEDEDKPKPRKSSTKSSGKSKSEEE